LSFPSVELIWVLWAVLSSSETASADRGALERMSRGDHDALGEIYDRHGRLVYSLALRIVRDQSDAEDVSQEVFSQAWRLAKRYDAARGTVLGWLLTLTRSRAIDRIRGRKSRPEPVMDDSSLDEIADRLVPQDEQLAWAGQAAQIRAALDGLSTLQRVAIELAFYEGLTHAEIAERLELPLGTVKTRIRQGLLTLRDRLAGVLR
jgi:RNA polymerase sigma-70 factor, ECF subfamily